MLERSDKRGFTLLELLIALAIVSIVLLGFFKAIDSTYRIDIKNDRDIKALNILQSEIEKLRNQIKTKPDNNGERKLFVEDGEGINNNKEIIFNQNNESKVDYSKIDKATNSKYKIDLRIYRELIQGNTQSINRLFNDYKYTIDISAVLEDKYFSKKNTEINNVQILGNNLEHSSKDQEETDFVNGVSYIRLQNQDLKYGNDVSKDGMYGGTSLVRDDGVNNWEVLHPEQGMNHIKLYLVKGNNTTFDVYAEISGKFRAKSKSFEVSNLYDCNSVKIDPTYISKQDKEVLINDLRINSYVKQKDSSNYDLINSYYEKNITAEQVKSNPANYEYKISRSNEQEEKIIEIEFNLNYDNNYTLKFLFGKIKER